MRTVLLSRWAQSLLGTAILAGLVWLFGPLWPKLEPTLPRVVAVQGLFVVWAVANALADWRRRMRDAALAAGLGAATAQEAEAVGQTMARALHVLKHAGQRARVFEQPWYAIIGPPGAGKTTALLNAGLQFTLAEAMGQAAVAGAGGTRLCEWWFTRDAVLIDTAGRYTTQDSDAAVDRAGWEAFLALLKRTRPRQPLNGVIVAIALTDIVQAPPAERDAHAATIARRIAELEHRFGMRLPVYALFTKADLIAGFSEFFDGLTREQREQVWGQTFALTVQGPAVPERFAAGFRALVDRLNERLLPRLRAEHRLDRRGLIAGFPSQVASLEKPLAAFIAAAFIIGAPSLLRGVYLTSGTQEGTPIDRLSGAMARVFGIDQARAAALRPEQGRSYFLARLLRDVIFGEAMLVREAPAAARRRRLLRGAGYAVVLLAALGTAAAMVVSHTAAERQIEAAGTALAAYRQAAQGVPLDPVADGDLRPLAALLDQAQALAAGDPPAPVGFGMGQGAKLAAGARAVYRNGLTNGLLPRLVWRLETQMRGSLNRPDDLYEATRTYLMLGGEGVLNPDQVRAWMALDWAQAYPAPGDAALRASLLDHLGHLLAEPLPTIPLDGALITQARASLGRVPLADRVYASIRASAAAAGLPPWRPADILGPAGLQIFVRASGKPMTDGIPGLFTAAGFQSVLLPSVGTGTRAVAAEAWVLGRKADAAPASLQDLEAAVAARYLADFTRAWDAMLADLNIEAMTSLPQGAQDLYILTSPESPLRALLVSAGQQFPPGPAAGRYKGLADIAAGNGAALDRPLRLMADMQQQLAKLAALPVGAAIPPGGEDIGAALLADAARQPQPLARWLMAVSASAQALRTGNARRQAAITYNAPGGPAQACQAAVAHAPFTANGTPLALDEFARVFGPGGLIDGFFNTQIKSYVDVTAKPWRLQPGAPAPVTAADVLQFQRAAALRDAFFPAGQATPAIAFEVAAASPDPVTLTIAGTTVPSGIGHATQVLWPGQDSSGASVAGDSGAAITEEGPWGLFRLFARGRLQPPSKGRQTLTFTLAGRPVAYAIRVSGRENPFAAGLFTDFRCPAVQ